MKTSILSFIIPLLFISFSAQIQAQDSNLPKQNACEAIPLSTLASLMDIDESLINQEDMSFGDKRSICYYYNKEGNRKFFIRMAWKSEKAQERKSLEKKYSNYLANGENSIKSYQEISQSGQDQILYGIGQDQENKYIHILRKRYGNKAEIQLELTKENKDEKAKDMLMKVLKEIK